MLNNKWEKKGKNQVKQGKRKKSWQNDKKKYWKSRWGEQEGRPGSSTVSIKLLKAEFSNGLIPVVTISF